MKTNTISLFASSILLLLLPACTSTSDSSSSAGVKRYPLQTCIVTGNKLGSMGEVVTKIYDGQEVKFCCKPCVKKFEADPAKFLRTLN